MAPGNTTQITEFILIGVSERPELQVPLFFIFLGIYGLTVAGNLGIITLTCVDSRLQSPMYFFLRHLAVINFSNSTVIAPKMLSNFLANKKTISYYACAMQLGGFLVFIVAEIFMLAVMAYDRYVAICNPLLYTLVVSPRVCLLLVSLTYLYGLFTSIVFTVCVFSLSFCSSNIIDHFYCDITPLVGLSCSDTYITEILIFLSAGTNLFFSMTIVVVSYFNIFLSILRIQSSEGRKKAFSTCGSHMTAVTVFYGTLLFMYLQPGTNHTLDTDKLASVFYTLVIPMLNPMIYSLRNKDVKAALQSIMTNPCASFLYSLVQNVSSSVTSITHAPKFSVLCMCRERKLRWQEPEVDHINWNNRGHRCFKTEGSEAFKNILNHSVKSHIPLQRIRHMADTNCTQVTHFILLGLTDRQELKMPLFMAFLSIYIFTVVGNLGLILVIRTDARLNTPMYFFLSNLAFVDFCYTSVITPKMLGNFLYQRNLVSFHACAAQLGCFLTFMVSECLLLASMAYDRYVAICNPLLYKIRMSPGLCIQLVTVPYGYSFLMALFHTILTFRLCYCLSNVIDHFYCDDMPLLGLTCSDTHSKQLWVLTCAGITFISSVLIVFVSYMFIISAILKMRSAEGRRKAFSTCGSHVLAVTIFYGTLIFMYLQPSSNHSLDTDKMTSVFYTVIIPMLNPLIYSLRNKDVKEALKKAVRSSSQASVLMKFQK
ncbi:uncharacterized protein O8D03_013189 [Erethizon dorsatum]